MSWGVFERGGCFFSLATRPSIVAFAGASQPYTRALNRSSTLQLWLLKTVPSVASARTMPQGTSVTGASKFF
jgi:hypothetical protein